jgi:MOSC domain-containing protein YiiM
MKLISLNVGLPKVFTYRGEPIESGIFKRPVSGRIRLRALNLEGDRQADLSVHGGPYKAVYGYPSEHYEFWRKELVEADLPWGGFGENFTTMGLGEEDLRIGDRFRIGSATVMVRQPRMPCYKLAAKFKSDEMIAKFLRSGRSGFYFSVEEEGEVGNGDDFQPISTDEGAITIGEMNRLFVREKYNRGLLRKAIETAALPEAWREYFLPRLEAAKS